MNFTAGVVLWCTALSLPSLALCQPESPSRAVTERYLAERFSAPRFSPESSALNASAPEPLARAPSAREPSALETSLRELSALEPSARAPSALELPVPLTRQPGDAARGRAIVANRQVGLCLLCHSGPFPEERFQGNLAPDLASSANRWSAGALRARLVDARRFNPETIMPAYFQTDGLTRVALAYRGQTLLSAQQIEDVIAFLLSLPAGGRP